MRCPNRVRKTCSSLDNYSYNYNYNNYSYCYYFYAPLPLLLLFLLLTQEHINQGSEPCADMNLWSAIDVPGPSTFSCWVSQ